MLIQINPKNAGAYYTRGTVYEKMGLLEQSVSDLTECLKIDPNHYNAAYARGACENKRGNYYKAIEDYDLAFAKDKRSNSSPRRLTLDRIHYLLGPQPTAKSLGRAASINPTDKPRPPRGLNLLRCEIESKLDISPHNKPISMINRIENHTPRHPDIVVISPLNSESTDLFRSSDLRQSSDHHLLASYASAASIKSDNPFQSSPNKTLLSPAHKSEAEKFHAMGYEAKKRGDYKEAIVLYSKAVEKHPKYLKAYFNRGFAYDKLGEYAKAIEDYGKVVELDPKNAYAFYNRGIAYDKYRRFNEAIEDFSTAIVLLPGKADFYHNRGFAYRKKREFEKAARDYTEAIRMDPQHFKVFSCA